jgi:oligopeptide/dipeptide ABC transporter ATP-binding protein
MAPLLEVSDLHIAVYSERAAMDDPEPSGLWVTDEERELGAGWRAAVRGVSFHVDEGEVLAIIGESGSGKTVSMLGAFNLTSPGVTVLSGTVELDGHTILPLPKERKPRRGRRRESRPDDFVVDESEWREIVGMQVGFLFQDAVTAWEPTTLIGDQSGEVLAEHTDLSAEEIEARVMDALGEVRLPKVHKYFSFAHELSRGQAQRAMLAAALIKAPRLLVADEPLSGLDTSVAAAILDLIADLREKRKMAMVIVTHDLATVANVADRVAVMYGGQIIEEGDAASLFNKPLHPYTEGLLGSIPWPGVDRLRPVEGEPIPIIDVPGGQCAFAPRCAHALDECVSRRPLLEPVEGRSVACIRAAALDLRGVRG